MEELIKAGFVESTTSDFKRYSFEFDAVTTLVYYVDQKQVWYYSTGAGVLHLSDNTEQNQVLNILKALQC